jgi:ferredoxin-NADP reductase
MFYSVADRFEAYFADELAKLASSSQQKLTFHLHDSSKSGFLTADIIAAQVKSLDGYAVLLCGPGGMMRAMRQQFVAHGVDNNNIDYEDFSLL